MSDYINTKFENAELIINYNNPNEAIFKIKERLKKQRANAELYCYLSKAYIYKGKYKEALKYAKKAEKINPNYLYAKARIVFALSKLKANKEDIFELVNSLFKKNKPDILTTYVCFVAIARNYTDDKIASILAKKTFNLIKNPQNAFEYKAKIESALFLKKYKISNKLIKEAECNNYLDLNSYQVISYLYCNNKKYKECIIYANKAILCNSESGYNYFIKGNALYKQKKYKEVINYLKLAEKYKYKSKYLNLMLAYSYLEENDYKNFLKYTQKVKRGANPFYERGTMFYNKKNYDKALNDLLKAEALGYKDDFIFTRLSFLYANKGYFEKSLNYANKAIINNSKDGLAHYRKGIALYNMKDYINAKESFLKAEKLNYIHSSNMFEKLSFIFTIENNYKQAINYANKAIILNSQNAYAYYRKGYALFYSQKFSKAKESLVKSNKLGYLNYNLFSMLSYLFYIENDFKKAHSYINKALLLCKDDSTIYYLKAGILASIGKEKEAVNYYQKALTLEKN